MISVNIEHPMQQDGIEAPDTQKRISNTQHLNYSKTTWSLFLSRLRISHIWFSERFWSFGRNGCVLYMDSCLHHTVNSVLRLCDICERGGGFGEKGGVGIRHKGATSLLPFGNKFTDHTIVDFIHVVSTLQPKRQHLPFSLGIYN